MSSVGFYLVAWFGFVGLLVAAIALGRVYDREEDNR